MDQELEFELNLNPSGNRLLTNYGFLCNPFSCDDAAYFIRRNGPSMRQLDIMKGLALGATKECLPKALPELGLSQECIDLIISKVSADHKYKIKVEWFEGKGSVIIQSLDNKAITQEEKIQ